MKRSLPSDRKLADGAGHCLAQGLDLLEGNSEAQAGESLQEAYEQVLQLHSGQVRAGTEVRAAAHGVPGAQGDTVDLDVDGGAPGQAAAPSGSHPLDRAGEPEDLFDGLGGQRRLTAQRFPLLGMGQQQQHAPVDDGDDGCMPGEQQTGGEMGDPVVVELRSSLAAG